MRHQGKDGGSQAKGYSGYSLIRHYPVSHEVGAGRAASCWSVCVLPGTEASPIAASPETGRMSGLALLRFRFLFRLQ